MADKEVIAATLAAGIMARYSHPLPPTASQGSKEQQQLGRERLAREAIGLYQACLKQLNEQES